ncbi:hypothetical protein I7I48_04569 [Histoplasma ohiense]|nr:hypothetical protein I7I48_04569 [Histoplasma ohiense (nom. inval.)]
MRLFTPSWARRVYKPTIICRLALIGSVCQLRPAFSLFPAAHAHHTSTGPKASLDNLPKKAGTSMLADVQQLFERLPTSVRWSEMEPDPKFGDDLDPSDPLMPYLGILLIVDRLIPPKTLMHFFEFAGRGTLPNGKKTKLPVVSSDEIELIVSPYNEWALPPHNKITYPADQKLMTRLGSDEDAGRLTIVEKPVHAMKIRLWEGIAPISEHQWRQKGLDKAENFDYACQYIETVISTFDYLNVPLHVSHMRETFNYMYEHLSEFDEALNNIRRRDGKEPNVDMAGLWADFIRAKYQVMTDRAYSWTISHIDALREPLLNEIKAWGALLDDKISPEQLVLVEKLRKLSGLVAEAEYTIYLSTDGYKGGSDLSPEEEPNDRQSPTLEKRRTAYVQSFEYFQYIEKLKEEIIADLQRSPEETPATENGLLKTIETQIRIQKNIQARRDPVPEPSAPVAWISDITNRIRDLKESGQPPMTDIGYAIYRLSYGRNADDKSEWDDLKKIIEKDLASWGDGINGVEDIKPFLKVKWFDGRELGLAEDDIDGAKGHFTTYLDTITPSNGIYQDAILILDSASLASYSKPTTDDIDDSEDHHLLVVDPKYDPDEGIERPEESPGYAGSMRILTRLVWSELFALTYNNVMWLEDMWPLAMGHPEQVYVGQTAPELLSRWAKARIAGDSMLKARFETECKQRGEEEVAAWNKKRREKEL